MTNAEKNTTNISKIILFMNFQDNITAKSESQGRRLFLYIKSAISRLMKIIPAGEGWI